MVMDRERTAERRLVACVAVRQRMAGFDREDEKDGYGW